MIKKALSYLILGAVVIALLFFYLLKSPVSARLDTSTATMEEGDRVVTETSYVDDRGRAVVATDKGYAIYRKTQVDKLTVLEEYLDADGNPVMLPAGYSAIERVYTDQLNTEIRYLDTAGQLVIIANGYDTIRRTFNALLLADTDTYYASGTQVMWKQGYASLRRIYGTGADEKRIIRQEYRDLDGKLTLNSSGYAYLTRAYNEAGKIREERYFGTVGEPISLSIGQYGYCRIYDEQGRTIQTTYLDAEGAPIDTKNRYAAVKTVYSESGTRHMYFDRNDRPVTGTHGEYGYTTTSDGRKVYLDSGGQPLRRLDIFLNSNSYAVLILGFVFTLLALYVQRWKAAFLILYLAFICLMTLAWREGIDSVKGELFWSYKQFMSSPGLRQEIIKNVFLFIPLGCILTRMPGNLTRISGENRAFPAVLICLLVSAAIEIMQRTMLLGTFEWDDMISNGVGGAIGAMMAVVSGNPRESGQVPGNGIEVYGGE